MMRDGTYVSFSAESLFCYCAAKESLESHKSNDYAGNPRGRVGVGVTSDCTKHGQAADHLLRKKSKSKAKKGSKAKGGKRKKR